MRTPFENCITEAGWVGVIATELAAIQTVASNPTTGMSNAICGARGARELQHRLSGDYGSRSADNS